MRAFVAGSTGYTGQSVVEELLAKGIETVAHIRPGSSRREDLGVAFEEQGALLDLTPWEPEAMRETLERLSPQLVFCLIGTTKARQKELEARGEDGANANYEAVDYGLTKLLVDACAALGEDAPRFIYLSSMGVGPNGLNAYMKARYKAEQAVQQSGVPYTIARPGIITGEDREESRPLEQWSGKINDALFGIVGALGGKSLAKRYRSTDASELARALVRLALEHERADDALHKIVEAQDLKDL